MSEYTVSEEPGGSPLTRKYGGVPGYVWLIGAGVLAYFLFFRGSSSSSGGTSSNPSGTSDNSTTDLSGSTLPSSPVTVNVTNPPPPAHNTPNPQPKPKPPPKKKVVQKKKPVKAKPKSPGEPED